MGDIGHAAAGDDFQIRRVDQPFVHVEIRESQCPISCDVGVNNSFHSHFLELFCEINYIEIGFPLPAASRQFQSTLASIEADDDFFCTEFLQKFSQKFGLLDCHCPQNYSLHPDFKKFFRVLDSSHTSADFDRNLHCFANFGDGSQVLRLTFFRAVEIDDMDSVATFHFKNFRLCGRGDGVLRFLGIFALIKSDALPVN